MKESEYQLREKEMEELTLSFNNIGIAFVTLTGYFVYQALMSGFSEFNYSGFEVVIALIVPLVIGAIVAMFVENRFWWGCGQFSAFAYIIATIFSIPPIREFAGSVQVVAFLIFWMLGFVSMILHRLKLRNDAI